MDSILNAAPSSMADSASTASEPRTPRMGGAEERRLERRKSKTVNDPVHDHIELAPIYCAVIDGKPFQRLRRLKQLGCACYVYPGASHTRFEHSLGVGHLAETWADALMIKDRLPHEERERYSELVGIAGLCHDLGHGPFSHLWEKSVLPALDVHNWHHEDMSERLVEYIFDTQEIYEKFEIDRHDMSLIKRLISGVRPMGGSGLSGFPMYLFDIVNNRSSGIDVDKLDYLQRDALHTNVKVAAPYGRLLQFAMPDGDGICYRLREKANLRRVYEDRANLYDQVYTHKTSRAIDHMICDALKEVGSELRLAERSQNVFQFLQLTDTIVEYVQNMYDSNTPAAQRARQILTRIETRDLYTLCGEKRVSEEYAHHFERKEGLPMEIISHQSANGQVNLRPEDICVSTVKIDCGTRSRNPLQRVRFYQERRDEVTAFDEQTWPRESFRIRVYCKKKEHVQATEAAFRAYERSISQSFASFTPEQVDRRVEPDDMVSD